jgi:DNA-binding NarL/FixJ family response regulator
MFYWMGSTYLANGFGIQRLKRRAIYSLRPLDLEGVGSYPALRQLVDDLGDQNPFAARLEVSGPQEALPAAYELPLFRVIQQGLNNVSQHARASSVLVRLAVDAGARGYLLKTVDAGELIVAIEAAHRGDYLIDPIIATRVLSELHTALPELLRVEPLTEGEMAVLRLVAQGVGNRDIARTLDHSVHTVANRLRTIYQKLYVAKRPQKQVHLSRS